MLKHAGLILDFKQALKKIAVFINFEPKLMYSAQLLQKSKITTSHYYSRRYDRLVHGYTYNETRTNGRRRHKKPSGSRVRSLAFILKLKKDSIFIS